MKKKALLQAIKDMKEDFIKTSFIKKENQLLTFINENE